MSRIRLWSVSGRDRHFRGPSFVKQKSMSQTHPTPGPPAHAVVLQMLTGKWVSAAIAAAAKFGIADHLESGPKSAKELAALTGTHEQALYRLLRAQPVWESLPSLKMAGSTRRLFLSPCAPTRIRVCATWPCCFWTTGSRARGGNCRGAFRPGGPQRTKSTGNRPGRSFRTNRIRR